MNNKIHFRISLRNRAWALFKKETLSVQLAGWWFVINIFVNRYGSGFGFMGKLFGENSVMNMSNSILGAFFYTLQFALSNSNLISLQWILEFFNLQIFLFYPSILQWVRDRSNYRIGIVHNFNNWFNLLGIYSLLCS